MGRVTRERGKCEYEALRNDARMLENKARLESLAILSTVSKLREASSAESKKPPRPYQKRVYGLTPLRRSQRINAAAANRLPPPQPQLLRSTSSSTLPVSPKQDLEEQNVSEMGRVTREGAKCEYESLRKARVLENKARLESLGILNAVSQLREASAGTKKPPRPYHKRVYGLTPLRRSQRINAATGNRLPPPRSRPLKRSSTSTHCVTPKQEKVITTNKGEEEKKRPANAPLVELKDAELLISAGSSARRCNSKGRGSVYNPVLGICCHFCRQKTLCGEEDCKRCGDCDVDEPCLGKTDCSVCHSSTGVFCRACLKVRYGEEIEQVRENKGWMCPHCIEEKGINHYWICNSSICLRKRKMSPTGLAIYRARKMGYKSVAHLLMEELKRGKWKQVQKMIRDSHVRSICNQ